MKYFVVVFVAFAVIAFSSGTDPAAVSRIQLGNVLKYNSIYASVQQIVQSAADAIAKLVPCPKSAVPLNSLFNTLYSLGAQSTIGVVVLKSVEVFGANAASVVAYVPKFINNTGVNINNLVAYIQSQAPPNSIIPFTTAAWIFGTYFFKLLTIVLVNFLNTIS